LLDVGIGARLVKAQVTGDGFGGGNFVTDPD
jgi:hypothetical protein